jgi:hypothetical protein
MDPYPSISEIESPPRFFQLMQWYLIIIYNLDVLGLLLKEEDVLHWLLFKITIISTIPCCRN